MVHGLRNHHGASGRHGSLGDGDDPWREKIQEWEKDMAGSKHVEE
jgi:hypothetical protein